MKTYASFVFCFALALQAVPQSAFGAEPVAPPVSDDSGATKVNVDTIKEKYWAQGNESELGVVQNRLYSKARKIELGVFSGLISSDPFLSTKSLGMSVGFHFSEYFAAHILGWKSYAGPSAALTTSREQGKDQNINPAYSFMGGELAASLLYGKLSLIGKAIIYYDLHVSGGAGLTSTESGSNFTPFLGIGQQVYLSKNISFMLNYRVMRYSEKIVEKVITANLGEEVAGSPRPNYTHALTLGVTFLFGFGQ